MFKAKSKIEPDTKNTRLILKKGNKYRNKFNAGNKISNTKINPTSKIGKKKTKTKTKGYHIDEMQK